MHAQVGDSFVLNVLGEAQSGPTMKHFLKRFPPGADRFEGVATDTAANGCPVLRDGIAHLECSVRLKLASRTCTCVSCPCALPMRALRPVAQAEPRLGRRAGRAALP